MIELGSWNRVHNDKRYKEYPQPVWQARGIADCGDFICDECVVKGG